MKIIFLLIAIPPALLSGNRSTYVDPVLLVGACLITVFVVIVAIVIRHR